MQCIYFTGEICEANPTPHGRFNYKPNKQEREDLCTNMKFRDCPRYQAYIEDMKASE